MTTTRLQRPRYSVAALALTVFAACVDTPFMPTPTSDVLRVEGTALINKPPIDQTLEGEAWVCKDGSGPATSFTFNVLLNGTASTHTVALGMCVQVATVPTNVFNIANLSVTEATPPTGWSLTNITIESNSGSSHNPVINPPNATARISNDFGVVITFTNAFEEPPPPNTGGRMTGGGVQLFGDIRVSRGFTIHCDLIKSNNLEINWKDNKWHIDKPLTKATCIDDPAYTEKPPVAPFNTFIGEGIGRLNGVDGSKVIFTFIDAGEPGKNDKAALRIIAPDGVTVVLDIPLQLLDHGNIQAHYDQPHGQKPPK